MYCYYLLKHSLWQLVEAEGKQHTYERYLGQICNRHTFLHTVVVAGINLNLSSMKMSQCKCMAQKQLMATAGGLRGAQLGLCTVHKHTCG